MPRARLALGVCAAAIIASGARAHTGGAPISLQPTVVAPLLMGVLIGIAPEPFYDSYADRVASWGFTLLADQQLAGVLMMVVGSMIYLKALVIRAVLLLRAPDGRVATMLTPQPEGISR